MKFNFDAQENSGGQSPIDAFGYSGFAVARRESGVGLGPGEPCRWLSQTLDAAGKYVLTGDLDWSGTLGSGVNVTAIRVTFHLAGSSTDFDLVGARMW
jgi:hypothetical protein